MTDTAVLLQETANYSNASFASSSSNLEPLLPVLLVVTAGVIVLAFSTRAYRWAIQASSAFASSLEYAIKGVATVLVIAVFAAPLYALSQTTPGQRELVAQAGVVLIVGYIGLVTLGIIGDRVWSLLARRHEEVTGHRPFENWGEEASDDV